MFKRFFFIIIASSSCYGQNLSEFGLDCIRQQYESKGIDIDSTLSHYESFLVKKGYLVKDENQRMKVFFETVVKEDAFILTILKTYPFSYSPKLNNLLFSLGLAPMKIL